MNLWFQSFLLFNFCLPFERTGSSYLPHLRVEQWNTKGFSIKFLIAQQVSCTNLFDKKRKTWKTRRKLINLTELQTDSFQFLFFFSYSQPVWCTSTELQHLPTSSRFVPYQSGQPTRQKHLRSRIHKITFKFNFETFSEFLWKFQTQGRSILQRHKQWILKASPAAH